MSIIAGQDVVLQFNMGTDSVPNWQDIGPQVTGELSIEGSTVDVTTKQTKGWADKLRTFSSWSFSCEGKLDRSDLGVKYLENIAMRKTSSGNAVKGTVHLRWRFQDGATAVFEGKGVLENFAYTFPVEDAASWSASISGAGELSRTEPVTFIP